MPTHSTSASDHEKASRGLLQDYLTEAELAAGLGVTVRCLQVWRKKRQGPAWTKIGKRVIYRRAAVADWMKASEQRHVRERRSAA